LCLILASSCTSIPSEKEKIIIYLHGMGKNPLHSEKKNIEAMKSTARKLGYQFVAPEAVGNCYYLNPPKPDFKCWDHLKIEDQLNDILKGHTDKEVILIGFSNGAYFLGGALERNLLNNISRIGLISGGSIWMKNYPKLNPSPKVFIENGLSDKWNKKWVAELHKRLMKNMDTTRLFFRELKRRHQPSAAESTSFITWLLKQND
jgi:predicted esterase